MAAKQQPIMLNHQLREQIAAAVRKLPANQWYYVNVEPWRPQRTLAQSDWFHGFIIPAMQHLWDLTYGEPLTFEDAKWELRKRFLEVVEEKTNRRTGEIEYKQRVRHTSELTTVQMAEFCELCRDFIAQASDGEILVPDPDPKKRSGRRSSVKQTSPSMYYREPKVEDLVKAA